MRALVVADYRTRYHDPIRLDAGQIVRLGERDSEWPAFVWTQTDDGRAGWAPCDWLRPLDAQHAEALRAYDARELDVEAGQWLRLIDELGGWWWAQREHDGAQGWVPARHLGAIETQER
ncbi:SH3 domain-containing protein [Lysobacter sp. CA199]|uniref:SH3 domain-containing protein n=1 Tax=Lysobacter sp. CA199 TaxID=3455608 RepID=UPI003F8D16F7